jgi:hypothetical protein
VGFVDGEDGSVTSSAGVRIVEESLVDQWFDHIVQGVLDNSVSEWKGRDQPFFWFIDIEISILSDFVKKPDQFVLDRDEILVEVGSKFDDILSVASEFLSFFPGKE